MLPCASLPYNRDGVSYVILKRIGDGDDVEAMAPVGTFTATLRFMVKDVDPSSGEADSEGIEDE